MAENQQTDGPNILSAKLGRTKIPDNVGYDTSKDREKMVDYGKDNLYPDFLLDMYSNSPAHGAILNSKSTYIIGGGLKIVGGDLLAVAVNKAEPIGDFVKKCVLDYEIFNYFGCQVVYNKFKEPIEFIHIPAQLIRTNKNKSIFWYRENWAEKAQLKQWKRVQNPNSDNTSKFFFFDGYSPSKNLVYPAPGYMSAVTSIVTDMAIKHFNFNNITNHFSVSTLITFFQGSNLPDEVKKKVLRDITESYTGEHGKKIIVDFQNANGKSADVKNISPNSWDAAYATIAKNATDDIFIGHQVTSPMLMGVKTEGQLGGATELETAYEIFKANYILGKRDELCSAFNRLFAGSRFVTGKVEFLDKPLFTASLTPATREKVYTINELRALDGKGPIPDGDRLLTQQPVISAPAAFSSASPQPTPEKDRTGWVKQVLKDEDFEKVVHLGSDKAMFEVVGKGRTVHNAYQAMNFEKKQALADLIINSESTSFTVPGLVSDLKEKGEVVTEAEVKNLLKDLKEAGVINSSVSESGAIEIEPNKTQDKPPKEGGGIVTMYEYVLRAGIGGADIIPTSRGFCRKLIANNKYYSRADIQTMSGIFGYDVFQHAGGWYHNPETGENEDQCRHKFQAIRLKKKANV